MLSKFTTFTTIVPKIFFLQLSHFLLIDTRQIYTLPLTIQRKSISWWNLLSTWTVIAANARYNIEFCFLPTNCFKISKAKPFSDTIKIHRNLELIDFWKCLNKNDSARCNDIIKLFSLVPSLVTATACSVLSWKYISQYAQDGVSNMSHLPAVNYRIQRRINEHHGPCIQINYSHKCGRWC